MSHNKLILTGPKQQSGAVLVVALVLLLLLTLTGVTSMSTTTSELKVASNQQAYNSSLKQPFQRLNLSGVQMSTGPLLIKRIIKHERLVDRAVGVVL